MSEENENKEEQEELDLSCPCYPQCPNYGKCRVCIATHAKFYTPPHCVKWMQEKMKKEHIHPSNPHLKKTLAERIAEACEKTPGIHIRELATTLKVTEWQIVNDMPGSVSVPKEAFGEVYAAFAELDHVLLHIDGGAAVMQVTTKLPPLTSMQSIGVVKTGNDEMSLTGLILQDSIYAMFLVRENLYGKESLSLAIVDEDEKISLSIYLPKNDGVIDPAAKACFEQLAERFKG